MIFFSHSTDNLNVDFLSSITYNFYKEIYSFPEDKNETY